MKVLLSSLLLLSFHVVAQTPETSIDHSAEIKELREKVEELTEISNEQSEIIKRQLKDTHFDQNSRGYLELKFGFSKLDPEDIEDENDDTFDGATSASWEQFDYSHILDLEIGKSILSSNGTKHDFGVGYQHMRSKELKADYLSTGNDRIKVTETILVHTLFFRYAHLFPVGDSKRGYIGPGVTLGYSPVSELQIDLKNGNQGQQITGESDSFLFEIFAKGKFEFTRYFSFVSTAGYKIQEAEDLSLSASGSESVSSKVDLDVSGLFATVGLAVSF